MGRVRLSRIVRVFAWTGLTSVGGGRYAYFYESLVAPVSLWLFRPPPRSS